MLVPEGKIVGGYNTNPMLNYMIYEVYFPRGQVKEYETKVITKNMLSQVDNKGYSFTIVDSIVDYNRYD